jgi:hypothetical protein
VPETARPVAGDPDPQAVLGVLGRHPRFRVAQQPDALPRDVDASARPEDGQRAVDLTDVDAHLVAT